MIRNVGRLALTLLMIATMTKALTAQSVELVSRVHSSQISDTGAANPPGTSKSISADGRYVVFATAAPNLVPDQQDTNQTYDLFLKDLVADTTILVSRSKGSTVKAGNGASGGGVISADGRYVAFLTEATDLVAGQSGNPRPDLFSSFDLLLFDRVTGTTSLVFSDGEWGASEPALSSDGRYLAFTSDAENLVPGQQSEDSDNVFLYDRIAKTFRLVSHTSPSATSQGDSTAPAISADGRVVAFRRADFSVNPAVNTLLLYDRSTGAVSPLGPGIRPVVSADGRWIALANFGSIQLYDRVTQERIQVLESGFRSELSLSADGRYLAFLSDEDHLVPGQQGDTVSGLFLFDRASRSFTLVSRRPGSAVVAAAAANLSMSGDGRLIAFSSSDPNLVPGSNGSANVFLFERTSGKTTLVSHAPASPSAPGNASSSGPLVNANGTRVVFVSRADNLQEDLADFNLGEDVFVYTLSSGAIFALTSRDPELPSLSPFSYSKAGALSLDGRWVAFESASRRVVAGQDASSLYGVFLYDRTTRAVTLVSRSSGSATRTGNQPSEGPVINADGRYVVFRSDSTDIAPGPSGTNLFLFDRVTGSNVAIGNYSGTPEPQIDRHSAITISADGRWVAYTTSKSDVIPGQQEPGSFGTYDVFLWDRDTRTTVLVSRSSSGALAAGNDHSFQPRMSADGRFIAFTSYATDLVPGQTGSPGSRTPGLFLYDRTTGGTTHVSSATGDTAMSADGRVIAFCSTGAGGSELRLYDRTLGTHQLIASPGGSPAISGDGRYVAFVTDQPGDLLLFQVYVYDRITQSFTLVTKSNLQNGQPSNGTHSSPVLSANGRYLAFASNGEDLVPGQISTPRPEDPNNYDIFLFDRVAGTTVLVNRMTGSPVTATGRIEDPFFLSASGRQVAFTSPLDLPSDGDFNLQADAFLFSLDPAGPVPLPTCTLLDTRRRADRPVLTSNVQRTVTVRGACGVPATAKQVLVKVTVFNPSGKGNLRFYPGAVTATPSGILRFERNATRTETFTLPLSSNGTLTILPFVAGKGTVHVAVEVNGYFNN